MAGVVLAIRPLAPGAEAGVQTLTRPGSDPALEPANRLAPPRWRAHWIWSKGDPVPQNFYLYCRKALRLERRSASAIIHVAADSRYKLYVNGTFVGRGPVRSDQRWQYYDTYDLAPFLRVGENVVSAIVHQYGVPTGSYTLGRGGFLLQGEVRQEDGRAVTLDTDETWRVLPSPAWDRDAPRVSPAIMWMEIYDARKEPRGWQRPVYDDSRWERPAVLGRPPVGPWENLVARDIPLLLEEERPPVAILDQGTVDAAPPAVRLNLIDLFGPTDGQTAYLFAYLDSPVAQRVTLSVQGLGMMLHRKLWVNGVPYSPAPPESETPARALLEFPLNKGWNELLVKVGRDQARWTLDLVLGRAAGGSYRPVKWYGERRRTSPVNRAWIAGPYGRLDERGFDTVYEIERVILGRAPGSRARVPGKLVKLHLGPGKNVAVTMAMERRRSARPPGLENADGLLRPGGGPASISTAASGGDIYLTLDFGKTVAGYVRLRLTGVTGGIVDLGYSEKLLDGHVDTLRGEFPWNFADRYIMRDGPQEWELFFWKGFRYLQLTFRRLPRPIAVEAVRLLFTSYPVQYRGAFESSDPLLNRIWEVGRWTLQLNMHDGYEDTPWREQSQWVGDAQVELLANYMTFGDVALGDKYLRQIAQGQDDQGALPAAYPAGGTVYPTREPLRREGTLPTFMAQWVSTLWDHYRYTGKGELVAELYPSVTRLMGYFDRFLNAHGLLESVPGLAFLDWFPGLIETFRDTPQGELTGLNSHYYRALLDAAEMAALVGDGARREEWRRKAERVEKSINERLWSEAQGAYAHGRLGDQWSPRLFVQDSVVAAYAGVAPPPRVDRSLAALGGAPSPETVQIGTPYFYFFYLQALRRAGRHRDALDATRQVYGGMLAAGATTWWEHLNGYASLSHAWSCAPNFDLGAHVLGVEPTAPGFAAFRVAPQPADLAWARGIIPTVRGDIAVEWKQEQETFELRVNVPMTAQVELSVPALGLGTTAFRAERPAERSEFQDGRARYWVMGPGSYRIDSDLSGSRPAR